MTENSARELAWLRGSFTPLVTPFAGGAVDYETFARLVERQAESGSHGVVITGTTGEPTSLTEEERARLFRVAVEAARGRLPIVAASGGSNHARTLWLTDAAQEAGVDAVMIIAPGFVKPSQEGLARHFVAAAENTDLPMLLYNILGRAGVGIAVDTVARVAEACPNLVGVKHASPDLDYVTDLLAALGEDFRVFCGLESLAYPMMAVGGAGVMSAVGNLFPEEVAAMCDAVNAVDHRSALELHRYLHPVNKAIFFDTNPVPLKAMLAERGLGNGEVRLPLSPASEGLKERLRAVLERYDGEGPPDSRGPDVGPQERPWPPTVGAARREPTPGADGGSE